MKNFQGWFTSLAGSGSWPYEWQRWLAEAREPRSQLVRIPTGMGKTLGVLAAWSWHRVHLGDDAWPRRLVWCLPMRVLVDQAAVVIRQSLERVGLLWQPGAERASRVGVHLLMGGTDAGGDWHLYPEESAVLIGTQDMLLSRALNRGYGAGRARWPTEFGLMAHDALWVMDEVQLMDVGLATSAQLQAFHDDDRPKGFRPRLTWWMSATLQPSWLESVDTAAHHSCWTRESCSIPVRDLAKTVLPGRKSLTRAAIGRDDAHTLAVRVLDEHQQIPDGEFGRITLVICNTVDRACETFDAIRALRSSQIVELVHSRFRPYERAAWTQRFLSRTSCKNGADRIIVSTQVIEAGVDISASCVITELAPWSSLVQRFGRCARYGGDGHALVVDRGRDARSSAPYSQAELEAAWSALESLDYVHIEPLEHFEASLTPEACAVLYPHTPKHLLIRREFEELFDTTPDLTGADLDVARFIRSSDDRDLQVFWIDVERSTTGRRVRPHRNRLPRRDELCPVEFLRARDWLCGHETAERHQRHLRPGVDAWVWDFVDGGWIRADRSALTPGRIVCVAADCGGYLPDRGFNAGAKRPVQSVPELPVSVEETEDEADGSLGSDAISTGQWKTIGTHTEQVVEHCERLLESLGVNGAIARVLLLAARWHDIGKAHPVFQGAIRHDTRGPGQRRPDRCDLAKAPPSAWLKPPGTYKTLDDFDKRQGFRHELASALALFAVLRRYQPRHPALLGPWVSLLAQLGHEIPENPTEGPATDHERAVLRCTSDEFNLLVYLVASHHGKVRAALHSTPADQEYRAPVNDRDGLPIRGVRSGDVLFPVALDGTRTMVSPLTLSLEPAALGLSCVTGRSWRDRAMALLDQFGPGALAWLESLVIAADRRASRTDRADPEISRNTEAQ